MPKILTSAMRAHLDEETTRLAAIWRITRKDGVQFFFTDHDRDIVSDGEVYRADAGFERTAIRSDAGFAVDNLDLVGVFAEGGIFEDEVRAGLFDGAEIEISFVNWDDPDGHGEIRLRRGTLGETHLTPQGYFHAELRGLSQPLAQSTLEVFSPNCRADLGDERCKFPIQPPELGRDQAVSAGAFYRVPTTVGTGSARYEDRIYEVTEGGTTASSQPAYDTTIGAMTMDGTATLKAYASFTHVASIEAATDHRIFRVSDELSGFADGWFDEGESPSRPAPTQGGPSRSSPGPRPSAGSSSGPRPGFPWRWVTSCGSIPATVKPRLITLAASAFGATQMTLRLPGYDEENDRLLFTTELDGARHLVSYSAETGVVWYVPIDSDDEVPYKSRFAHGRIVLYRSNNGGVVTVRSAEDGSLISSQGGFGVGDQQLRFDPRTGALYATANTGIFRMLPGRSSDDSAELGDVVTSLCERVGLSAADLDVTELTDEVHGFGIARQISVRGALEMLAAAYAFDAVESDHQLKFKKRGRTPSQVIAEQGLVPVNAEREAFIETRAQEVDLPLRFTVVYQDLERDADIGTQYAKRVAGPSSAMHSQNEATFDLPLMLSAAEAKGIALRQLHSAWLERTGYEWRLPWSHVDLEPADVVQVALDNGTLLNVRILETELGANLELAWKTVLEESSSYTVTAVPGGGLNYLPQVDPVSSEARLFLLDVPLIRDSDDAGRAATGHYWAAGAYFDPPWRGAVLFSSDDGAIYVAADETLGAVAWGLARTALPDTDLPFQTDTTSVLQVAMVSGSLASVGNLEMLNGANLAALIRADGNAELIQFQDAVLSQGIYALTTLLRGRRGTEPFTGGHAVGDLFVLLGGDGVTRRPLGLDRLGDTLHYRAIGRGGELRDARTAQLTLAGNDLKPYAPAQLKATGSWGSNVTLSWQRRTRVAGELIDGTGEVPLAEDTEDYELEILDGPGGAVLRTETGITTTSLTYTSGMQSADFGGAQTELSFVVYQISAQVGRGFAGEATVEILP